MLRENLHLHLLYCVRAHNRQPGARLFLFTYWYWAICCLCWWWCASGSRPSVVRYMGLDPDGLGCVCVNEMNPWTTLWDIDECLKFWAQKVKGQGHGSNNIWWKQHERSKLYSTSSRRVRLQFLLVDSYKRTFSRLRPLRPDSTQFNWPVESGRTLSLRLYKLYRLPQLQVLLRSKHRVGSMAYK